jgi:hypothetical protein
MKYNWLVAIIVIIILWMTIAIDNAFSAGPTSATLVFEGESTMFINTQGFKDIVTDYTKGKVDLLLPSIDGPIKGQGPFIYNPSAQYITPRPGQFTGQVKGQIIIEGEIKQGILTFTPQFKLKNYNFINMGGAVSGNYRDNYFFSTDDKESPVSIKVKDGAEVIQDYSLTPFPGASYNGKHKWRLTTGLETWRVIIDNQSINYLIYDGGPPIEKQAGLEVLVRRIIEVTLDKGKFKSGKGEASFISIKNYSNPSWAYSCKPTSTNIVGTGLDIEAERLDQLKWTARFNPPKTPEDVELKKKWEEIEQHKTPYIFPQNFTVKGLQQGNRLSLELPKPSGYTIGIYCCLDSNEIKKRGLTMPRSQLLEVLDIDRTELQTVFSILLEDGWSYSEKKTGSGSLGKSELVTNLKVTKVK